MKRFIVTVKEIWYQPVLIEALALVEEGDGHAIEHEFTYSHSLESDEWLIHEKDINSMPENQFVYGYGTLEEMDNESD